MNGIPDAVVEAAAEAMWRREGYTHWTEDTPDVGQAAFRANARAVLAAVEGPWREHIAQELFVNAETRKNEWEAIAVRSAARVVQKGDAR